MSVESWLAEFYPTKADSEEARKSPAGHSLRKWQGTTKKNLAKHKVERTELPLIFSAVDCALCQTAQSCAKCPVPEETGATYHEAYEQAYIGKPRALIAQLRKTYRARQAAGREE